MANLLKAIGEGIWDSIESPYKVVESAVKGDFGDAWHNLKAIPGNQERANSEIFNAAGIRGWVGDHPGESVGAVIGTVLAAPYVAAGAQSLWGAGGSTGLGATEFGKAPGKFGSMDFGSVGSPSFSGGAPNVPDFGMTPGGTNATGGWSQTTNWGEIASSNQSGKNAQAMADIFKSVGNALNQMDSGSGGGGGKAQSVSFKGAKMPAQQFDSGALQNQMAAQEFQNLAVGGNNLNIPGKKDLNALLGLA